MIAKLLRVFRRRDHLIDTLIAEAGVQPESELRRRWPLYDRELQRKAMRPVLYRKIAQLRSALDEERGQLVQLRRKG